MTNASFNIEMDIYVINQVPLGGALPITATPTTYHCFQLYVDCFDMVKALQIRGEYFIAHALVTINPSTDYSF